MLNNEHGASVGTESTRAFLNLSGIMDILTESLFPSGGGPPQADVAKAPFDYYQAYSTTTGATTKTFVMNAGAVIERVRNHPKFSSLATSLVDEPADIDRREKLYVGGRLKGDLKATHPKVIAFDREIAKALDSCAEKKGLTLAAIRDSLFHAPLPGDVALAKYMAERPENIRINAAVPEGTGIIRSCVFGETGTPQARHLTALETTNEGSHKTAMFDALVNHFVEKENADRSELVRDLVHWNQAAQGEQSVASKIANLLAEQGVSRIRVRVALAMMNSLVKGMKDNLKRAKKDISAAQEALAEMVERVGELQTDWMECGEDEHVNLNAWLTTQGEFALSEFMMNATFWTQVLPTWFIPESEVFERRLNSGDGIERQVSYALRPNGYSPKEGLLSFDARVQHCIDGISEGSPHEVKSRFVQLLVLHAIAPLAPRTQGVTRKKPREIILAGIEAVKNCKTGKEWAEKARRHFGADRLNMMSEVATAFIEAFREVGSKVIPEDHTDERFYYLNLHPEAIDQKTFGTAAQSPFVGQSQNDDVQKVSWMRCITVSEGHPSKYAFYSYPVRVCLRERTMRASGDVTSNVRRIMGNKPEDDIKMLRVFMMPRRNQAQSNEFMQSWVRNTQAGVVVAWNPMGIGKVQGQGDVEAGRASMGQSTLARIALSIFVNCVLRRLLHGLDHSAGFRCASITRVHESPKDPFRPPVPWSSESGIMAVGHALETMLGALLPTRMQGFGMDPGMLPASEGGKPGHSGNLKHRMAKVVDAGRIVLPMQLDMPTMGAKARVGIVSHSRRPCDVPARGSDGVRQDSPEDICIVSGRTHVVDVRPGSIKVQPGFALHGVQRVGDAEGNPSVIAAAIRRLVNENECDVIVMVGRKHGARRLGRSFKRNLHHENAGFLNALHAALPREGIPIYPLVADSIRMVRQLKQGEGGRVGCELIGHQALMGLGAAPDFMHGLMTEGGMLPIYGMSSMVVVSPGGNGQDRGERPQSTLSVYYILSPGSIEVPDSVRLAQANAWASNEALLPVTLALRAIHYAEAEDGPVGKRFKPVVKPFDWLEVGERCEEAGESPYYTNRKGSMHVSLEAVLSHVNSILDGAQARQDSIADAREKAPENV